MSRKRTRSHTCDQCQRSFFDHWNLSAHISAVHENLKPYVCDHPDCSRAFARQQHLRRHVAIVHLKERRFQCEHCDYAAGTRSHLKTHQRALHPDAAEVTMTATRTPAPPVDADAVKAKRAKLTNTTTAAPTVNAAGKQVTPRNCAPKRCPYKGCDKLYKYGKSLERHMRNDHNDALGIDSPLPPLISPSLSSTESTRSTATSSSDDDASSIDAEAALLINFSILSRGDPTTADVLREVAAIF